MDAWMYVWMDRCTDEWMDGWMDGHIDTQYENVICTYCAVPVSDRAG